MTQASSIFFVREPKFLFLQCRGKGNFLNSVPLRALADEDIAGGQRLIAVDLSTCTGMDSTFMGTLAGIARRLMALGGVVQIAEPSEYNRELLETLGLDALLEIQPTVALWRGRLDDLRLAAQEVDMDGLPIPAAPKPEHILEAHVELSDISAENAEKFKHVVEEFAKQTSSSEES